MSLPTAARIDNAPLPSPLASPAASPPAAPHFHLATDPEQVAEQVAEMLEQVDRLELVIARILRRSFKRLRKSITDQLPPPQGDPRQICDVFIIDRADPDEAEWLFRDAREHCEAAVKEWHRDPMGCDIVVLPAEEAIDPTLAGSAVKGGGQ